MSQNMISLRAHHGLCLAFFEGKGYSDTFVEHMCMILQRMQGNPDLQIIADADVVCEKCPNMGNGSCNTPDLVKKYDQKVLFLCGLHENVIIDWEGFSTLVSEQILKKGKRSMVCGDCEWNDICSAKEKGKCE